MLTPPTEVEREQVFRIAKRQQQNRFSRFFYKSLNDSVWSEQSDGTDKGILAAKRVVVTSFRRKLGRLPQSGSRLV